jgi:chemotaxis family two-component system response regulator Rcp1
MQSQARPNRVINVLLVEDDPAGAHLTLEALRDPQFPTRTYLVSDGEKALKFLQHRPPYEEADRPDLILLDLNLPKIDGLEVLARIKADATLADIPVFVLSASSNPSDIESAYRNQAAGYVTKFSELDKYFATIRSVKEKWYSCASLASATRATSEAR